MPATAGRVRMPANNRVHSSAALQTHGIWQSAIGYDPYAPNKDDSKNSSQPKSAIVEPEGENAYASFQGLLALARITGSSADEARGACKRCGRVGHLAFQCRNFLSVKDDNKEKDQDALEAAVLSGLEKIKGNVKIAASKEESEEEEESETSDSEVDSEIERIIAERSGKKVRSSRRKTVSVCDEDESDSDGGRKKRGRSKKRRTKKREISDSEEEDKVKKKRRQRDKRRKRDESSSEEEEEQHLHKRKTRMEKRRRRSHRYSEDSDSDTSEDSGRRCRRKNRKAPSPSDSSVSDSDDSRIGRGARRAEKRGNKRHREEEE